ncbi:MAG: sugar transferase [Rhodobacteraceae bacterium]|nr:sugar transferase [Paracoccaceae bacterium]
MRLTRFTPVTGSVDILARPGNAPNESLLAHLLSARRKHVVFVGAQAARLQMRRADYAGALQRADLILSEHARSGEAADQPTGSVWLIPELARQAADLGLSAFIYSARPGVAEAMAASLDLLSPGLRIAGLRSGYIGASDSAEAVAQINQSGADILLVAMGSPQRELWLDRHGPQLTARLALGVGDKFTALACRTFADSLALVGTTANSASGQPAAVRAQRRLRTMRKRCTQRLLDVSLSMCVLPVLLPLALLIGLAIKLDSPGPIIFRQTRIGKAGKAFTLYKFRSMQDQAERQLARQTLASDRPGLCFKARRDPRVTRVGWFLRRLSLDELPQILNVLSGDMAIVGPRPALAKEVAAYPARALGRLATKPGITGLWQVSGRADIGFEQMIDMDLAYSQSRSVLMDLRLIARTFGAVLSGRGAY